mgnify:CR=1 FL=1
MGDHQESRENSAHAEFGLPETSEERWPDQLPRPLQQFWDYCQSLKDPYSGRYLRAAFDPARIPALLGHTQIIERVERAAGPARYRWRLSGTEMRKYYGRDLTGSYMDEVFTGEVVSEINRIYAAAQAQETPHYLRSQKTRMTELSVYNYERIIVPFHIENGQPQLIGYWHWSS